MEHAIRAPRDGVVQRLLVTRGRPRRRGRGAGRDRRRPTRLADNARPWNPGKSTRSGARTCPSASRSTRSARATGCRTRPRRCPVDVARRVRRPPDRGGAARDRGRLLRLAEGDPAARRHRGGLPADPPGERRALPGARAQREGPRARARGGRARDRRLHGGVRDVQPQEHQRRRRRVDRAVPPGRRARDARRRSACAATSRPRSAAPTRATSRRRPCARSCTSCSTCAVDEISIGDTIGVATPADVYDVIETLYESGVTRGVLALHFHDTRGTALANVFAGLECGVDDVRRLGGRPRRLPLRAGRLGQPRDRGPPLPARGPRDRDGRRRSPRVVEASRFLAGEPRPPAARAAISRPSGGPSSGR